MDESILKAPPLEVVVSLGIISPANSDQVSRRRRMNVNFSSILAYFALLVPFSSQTTRQKRDATDTQPKIITNNGHLMFQTGVNHNITFQSNSATGGYINIDGVNFKTIIENVKTNKEDIDNLKNNGGSNLETRVQSLEQSLANLQPTGSVLQQLNELTSQIAALSTRVSSLESGSGGDATLAEKVRTLETQVARLNTLLSSNECQSNPCRNGGTCVDQFNSFFCRCPSNWQGVTCDQDVNECAIYAGTDLGCQNGATCINTNGGYTCQCTANWNGIRCTESHDDCTGASNEALCGHGTCVNTPRVQPGLPKYKCICNEGWTTDGSNPACTTDVDECSGNTPRCSVDPPVRCINLPGTFICESCPAGYSGNGYACVDINECLTNNGGCSQAPRVECINTPGSRRCGACPQGYEGDGVTCIWRGICSVNNGGCYPTASCSESPNLDGRTCTCPPGYIGNGVGNSGCVQQGGGGTTDACSNNPCEHGRCQVSGSSYVCNCDPGFTGTRCTINIDECQSQPCQNGGTCIDGVNAYRCRCTSSFTGTNCEEAQETCGGRLDGDSGSFRYPRTSGTNYPHSVSCAWVITVSTNKIIMVSFNSFNIEYHANCDYDFLQINDGPSASSHPIGKFCGTQSPINGQGFNSTHNQLYFWFRSDASVASDGFEVSWTSANPVCGGDLIGSDHGSINSPGYPGNYPNNRDCVWTVSVSPGYIIQFSFATLSLEHHETCDYDYIEIRDGLLDTDSQLAKYCSTQDPAPLSTTGPYAWIKFHSDASETDRGFHITYAANQAPSGCGGAFTEESGVVISPNYPNPYPHDAQCVWTITGPESEKLKLIWTNMDLEDHSGCSWDYVELRDGADETADFVGRYCGTTVPAPFTSNSNTLWLKFKSDASNRQSGFRATWETACGGTFSQPTGELVSPYFPGNYPSEKTCTYLIDQPVGYTITLTFVTFDIEGHETCNYDFLEVRNGASAEGSLIGTYCGATAPAPIVSTANSLWLKFQSDGSVQNNGFKATYTTNDNGGTGSGCGGSLTENVGAFQSPGHPDVYPHGIQCAWYITVAEGLVIRLTFSTFSLEDHSDCNYDYVEVYDNSTTTETGGLLGRYCGSSTPPVLTSAENVMTVIFHSDASVAQQGFAASYVGLNATTLCGGDLTDETGLITSPNYPNNYFHSRECEWTIVLSQGKQILLNITDFIMESHSSCNYDYLEIRNGGYHSSPLIGKYCGTQIEPIIRSDSNRMYLKMVTDSSQSARGFQIYYDGTTSGCGGSLTTPTGSFVSPNYPLAYGHNAECYWTITVARGSTINLVFVDFDIETHGTCAYDYVQVKEKDINGNELGRFCGESAPNPLTSVTNQLWVKFRTDVSEAGRGFHASYFSICNNRLTDFRGVIESPNFPDPYPHDRNCTWVIEASIGNTVNVSFSHFALEDHSNCRYDFVEFRDGEDASATSLGKYCGENMLPPDIASTGQYLYIQFVSDSSVASNGFRLEYVMNGCGGDLTGPTGELSSPNYPNPYPNRRECLWKITVEIGMRVELSIDDFDLESHSECNYDVLEVYGGRDDLAPLLTKLCHTQTTVQKVTATGNTMFLRFKSDVSQAGKGFHATYRALTGGCGGNFSTPTGTIVSPNYPSAYPSNTDCEWVISVEQHKKVELTFEDFDVEGHATCTYDAVSVYDGESQAFPLLLKACGNGLPNPSMIRSSAEDMYIRMDSDGSVQARGFKASYKLGCGGTMDAEDDGEIFSPNYPAVYPANSNCSWLILADHEGDRVTLTMTHLDLEDLNANCSHDYVVVKDGNNEFAPDIGVYCGTTIPAPITSQGPALYVTFVSDLSDQRTGFRAVYSKSISSCGGDLTSEHGAFNSPGFPNNYPNSVECIWTMTASAGNRIQLVFSFFDLQNDVYCNFDYVEVRDGGLGGTLLGRFCGNNIPANMTVGQNLWVKFRSDQGTTGQGFQAQYATLYGGDLSGSSGQIASPLHPSSYPNNAHYTWTVTVPSDHYVRITFQLIDIEGSFGRCSYDYIKFRDGLFETSPEIFTTCGTALPDPFSSTGNTIHIEFHTDFSGVGQGFLLDWEATASAVVTPTIPPVTNPISGCGGELTAVGTQQAFTSPGYPNGYANSLSCTWVLRAEQGNKVWFNISDIDLESHGSCNYDKVTVFDNDSPSNFFKLGEYCGREGNTNPLLSTRNVMTVQFTTDSSVNRTGFMANFKTACGGRLTTPVGVIMSPSFPTNYPANSDCIWIVQVATGRTVSLLFETFDIQRSADCSADYLQLLNGGTASSPPLGSSSSGRYCGNSAPTLPATSSNLLFVKFASDATGSTQGFKATYREESVTCGGRYTLTTSVTSGTIMSPNYPQNYPQNSDCVWVITAPTTDRIQIDVDSDFYIEQHGSCQYDFLNVLDGGTENSPSIGKYCGTTAPSSLFSTDNVIYIRFRSDDSVAHKGFRATYKIATCGGTVSGDSGSIMSPNYPANYDNSANCEWYIQGPTGHYLTLTFEAFNLEASSNCASADYVRIRELNGTGLGEGSIGAELGEFCGNTIPQPVDTSDNSAHVTFRSNNANAYSGFKLNYVASLEVCGGDFTAPTGVFTSPNFPGQYPHSRQCSWRITVATDRRVTLQFTSFNLEPGLSCSYDYVLVRNGLRPTSPVIARLCGNDVPDVIESSGNTMLVAFVSDGSESNGGFSATYSSNNEPKCGGTYPNVEAGAPTGVIQSPGYEQGGYNNSEECVWVLSSDHATIGKSWLVKFLDFALENHGECRYDYLEVREGTDETGTLVSRFCNNETIPEPIISPSPSVWMMFSTDTSQTDRGFSLEYSVSNCGGILTDSAGEITSPNYPNNYDHDDACAWLIQGPENSQITVTVTDLGIENHDQCNYDYLEFFNGGSYSSPSIGKFCGSNKPEVFKSQSNLVRIVFKSDGSSSARGFRLTYTADSGGCGGTYHSQTGTLMSPNFPSNYPHNTECIWEIIVDSGYHVLLQFDDRFEIERENNCTYDYVEVSDYLDDGSMPVLGRFCSSVKPDDVRSTSSRMRVKFRSDPFTNANGFSANWTTGCGAIYTKDKDIIQSPGFPNNYANNLHCEYLISVDPQKYVVFQFKENGFSIEGDGSALNFTGDNPNITAIIKAPILIGPSEVPNAGFECRYDYIEVFAGNSTDTGSLGKFCGATPPQPFSSLGQMLIIFHTDSSITDRGFKAEYVASDCGGVFTEPTGIIRTPTHPVDYHNNHNCSWYITVQEDRVVELKFDLFDVEPHTRCAYDYVEVFDGPDGYAPKIGRFCGDVIPDTIRSTENTLYVNFITDASVTKGGFSAAYTTTFGINQGCGGLLNQSSGSIGSVDATGNGYYENNLDCTWQIIVPNDNIVKVTFLQMDLESDIGCGYDYVEVRDGFFKEDAVIGKFCGNSLPSVILASSNTLYVSFVSDSSITRSGFNFTFEGVPADCGGVHSVTTAMQTITSPEYPGNYPHNLRCRWTLDAPENQQIYLEVTDIDIEDESSCQYDYMEIRDAPLGLNGQSVHACGTVAPPAFRSLDRNAQINFVTDGSSAGKGFSLNYMIASCNRTYEGDNGRILSPGYPGNYPVNAFCEVSVTVPEGHGLSLFFNQFYIEPHTQCRYDYLEVYNGSDDSAVLIQKLCGSSIPNPIFPSGNSVFMRFITDASLTHLGYDITYTSSPNGCGGNITSTSGSLTSPGYPGNYPHDKTCEWLITVPKRRVVKLKFSDFNMEAHSSCQSDYLAVYDGPDSGARLHGRYCGAVNPADFDSSTNQIFIQFRSDSADSGTGFRVEFSS
ncbi:unnamed protein product [Owenia fusiformis]|uniref:Cubilin n=1 Tax=Owenia fusiformis TaxID=6347 RepID=A0A8S4N4I1_OWEFU|nr:unnamed protein product [Owenia fusiformis]